MTDSNASSKGLSAQWMRWHRALAHRWPTGFVDLPRDAPQHGEASERAMGWALRTACVASLVGYVVAMFGLRRVNSMGLSAWVPTWWLVLAVGVTFVDRRSTERPSPRVAVVRCLTAAVMSALSVPLVRVMLSNRLFALGHQGDNPSAPGGAVCGCASVFVAPLSQWCSSPCYGASVREYTAR